MPWQKPLLQKYKQGGNKLSYTELNRSIGKDATSLSILIGLKKYTVNLFALYKPYA
ncbi:hypothetical protein PRO82_000112 [Candidatus Protochlamydia amoebophila]|nr:hypothetical protein [Candidatus Protochlamydia amoebophila]